MKKMVKYAIVIYVTIVLILVLLGILGYSIFLVYLGVKYLSINVVLAAISLLGGIATFSIFVSIVQYLSEDVND